MIKSPSESLDLSSKGKVSERTSAKDAGKAAPLSFKAKGAKKGSAKGSAKETQKQAPPPEPKAPPQGMCIVKVSFILIFFDIFIYFYQFSYQRRVIG